MREGMRWGSRTTEGQKETVRQEGVPLHEHSGVWHPLEQVQPCRATWAGPSQGLEFKASFWNPQGLSDQGYQSPRLLSKPRATARPLASLLAVREPSVPSGFAPWVHWSAGLEGNREINGAYQL